MNDHNFMDNSQKVSLKLTSISLIHVNTYQISPYTQAKLYINP